MKVLVTGGAGFIGSFIVEKLLKAGDDVIIYDSFTNFTDPLTSHYPSYLALRFREIIDKDKVELVRGDIRNKVELLRAFKEHMPDAVIHLAALPISTVSTKFSEDAMSINLNGTVNILESLRETESVKRFIFASSSMVYGDFKYSPADEEHPKSPLDVYGATKKAGELLTRAYTKQYGIKHTIIRPSAVYGPTDSNLRVTQIFIDNALTGKPLTLHNGGESKLDFTYVEDTAEGFVLALKSDKAVNETFNITRGEGRSLKELAEIIKKHIPNTKIEFKEIAKDEKRPERGALGIKKAKKLLGYNPGYNLEDGMKKYIEFVKKSGVLGI